MNLNIIHALNEKQKTDLLSLYHDAWWSKDRTPQDIALILSQSSFYIGITDNQKLIAFSRVLTDYFQFSYIYDVIVHESYRGHGVGKKLIETILNQPCMKKIKNIELVCPKEMMPFYTQFGFSNNYGQSTAMRLQPKQ
jgi:predicted GNAT family N-acyltransferase